MYELSRRNLIMSAAAATTLLGLPKTTAFFGVTPAAADAAMDAGFYKFKVGDIELTALFDGYWDKDHDPAFIKGATVEETKKALEAAGLPSDKVRITFSALAAKIGDKTILFDTGTGGQLTPTAGLMRSKTMAAAGIDPAAVSTVLITHIHPDHVFGLMEKDTNAPLFPNAEVVIAAAEYKFWTDPALPAKMPADFRGFVERVQAVFPKWKNVRQVEADTEVVPGIKVVSTPGHTPGHTTYQVSSGGKVMYALGDITNIPALFLKHPTWQVQFDMDGDLAQKTRLAVMDRVIGEGAMVYGFHFPFPAAGMVAKDGDGYAFTPAA